LDFVVIVYLIENNVDTGLVSVYSQIVRAEVVLSNEKSKLTIQKVIQEQA
jgi:hypothetical protein